MSMPSEELQLMIAGYVLGDLEPEEAARFEQLLAQEPAIAATVAQMQRALELSYAPPEVSPPAHVRSSLLARFEQPRPEWEAGSRPRIPRRLPWRGMVEAAAAALILVLGWNNYRLWQTLQASSPEPNPSTPLTYVLNATQTSSQASATVTVDPTTLEATLSVKNLPPPPAGKVYVLWTVVEPSAPFTTDEKSAILTETFQVDDRGNFSQTIVVPKAFRTQDWVTKVAVTLEDASAPQKHTGSPIMITNL